MNFKEWLILSEALDANTKNLLAKQKAPKDQLDAFIKELEDEPTLIDNKTAFQRFQAKFNIQKKEKPKDEDAQRKHFATIPNTTEEELQTYDYYKKENKDSLKEMMELLRKFIDKKLITLKIENKVPNLYRNALQGSQKIDTPDFTRFMSSLHGIQGSLEQYKSKGNYFNPIEEELNHKPNLVAKGNNVWVFKGHAPDVCRIYGKGHPWCISSSTSAAHWFIYRIEHHQTQYFVFDFNKDEDDPARYVNPGVAPEGMYSEWVDATNQHDTDPEDSESEVGINGYKSINEYKKYLASKGIPESIWTTTPPEDWEERLHEYDENRDFQGAKNDSDSRIFPMYLKIVNTMKDSDFDTLTDDQKKEFLLGKEFITGKQLKYVMKEFKGEYYNSFNLDGKILFALTINDQDLLLKLIENPKLSDHNVSNLLVDATDKDKMAELIIKKKPELSDENVSDLLISATDKDKMAELIIKKQQELSDKNVLDLLYHATEKDEIAELLGKDNINKLSDNSVHIFLRSAFRYVDDNKKEKLAELIIKYKSELTNYNVLDLLYYATDIDKVAELLGKDNINKLSDSNVHTSSRYADNKKEEKDKMAQIIIKYKSELNNYNVLNLLRYATDKDKIAELLQRETDNISKLNSDDIDELFEYGWKEEKEKMAQIINQYHKKKTPEIQEILDKYLNEI